MRNIIPTTLANLLTPLKMNPNTNLDGKTDFFDFPRFLHDPISTNRDTESRIQYGSEQLGDEDLEVCQLHSAKETRFFGIRANVVAQ